MRSRLIGGGLGLALVGVLGGCAAERPPEPAPEESRSPFLGQFGIQWGGGYVMSPETGNPTGLRFPGAGQGYPGYRVLSDQSFPDMFFRHYGVNPTIDTEEDRFSTFSVDVDTASYTLARAYLDRGELPPAEAVRVEEFVNSFHYGYSAPPDELFTLHAEAVPSPDRSGYHVLHLGLLARPPEPVDEREAAHLVLVIDASGSMEGDGRLGLVKRSVRLLVDALEEGDTVGVVAYDTRGRVLLEPVGVDERERVVEAVESLRADGSTNAQEGLRLGYEMASRHRDLEGTHRLVLCSDGVANAGVATTADGIHETVREHVERGIAISTIGFGMGNYDDVLMERLAQRGDGNYSYVDREEQARRVLVAELRGTVGLVARDVKVQIEFDPEVVARYRLIGYENRALPDAVFLEEHVEAGAMGPGQSVTALYEIKIRSEAADGEHLAAFRMRYRPVGADEVVMIGEHVPMSVVVESFDAASSPTRLSLAAAAFAEKLRGSYWARAISYDAVLDRLDGLDPDHARAPEVRDLYAIVALARRWDRRDDAFARFGPADRMSFEQVPILLR